MTTELMYLSFTALLASALWIPYIVGVNLHPNTVGDVNLDFKRPRDLATVPDWVHRAHRAHLNLIEQLVPMAILILIAHQVGVSTFITAWSVVLFFWLRVVHAVGMISGMALFPLRPIIFTAGWICALAVGWEIIFSA